MSQFTGPLIIEEVQPGRRWRLVEPIRYEAGAEGSGDWIIVPAGFETDGASIPSAIRTVLAVWGTYGRAACVHDYLYQVIREGRVLVDGRLHPAYHPIGPFMGRTPRERRRAARLHADLEFRTAMIACGTARWLAELMFVAVRLFGAGAVERAS